jgi:light-regulated signal transduction histidine kinase (bacteriophytochrome)
VNLQGVDITKLVIEILQEFRETDPKRQVEFIIKEGVRAKGDKKLLRVLFENFLGNAWKFTSKQSNARIEFGSQQKGKETIYFIRDNGVGFNMKFAHKLFGTFQRLHDSKEFRGTGIGLAIIQRIVQKHHGKVWAKGKEGEGATFYFTL